MIFLVNHPNKTTWSRYSTAPSPLDLKGAVPWTLAALNELSRVSLPFLPTQTYLVGVSPDGLVLQFKEA